MHIISALSPRSALSGKFVSSVYKCSSCSPLVPEPFSRPPAPVISIIGAGQHSNAQIRDGAQSITWKPMNIIITSEADGPKIQALLCASLVTRTLGPDITMARESGAVELCPACALCSPAAAQFRDGTHRHTPAQHHRPACYVNPGICPGHAGKIFVSG